jgi:hypothetical protein
MAADQRPWDDDFEVNKGFGDLFFGDKEAET